MFKLGVFAIMLIFLAIIIDDAQSCFSCPRCCITNPACAGRRKKRDAATNQDFQPIQKQIQELIHEIEENKSQEFSEASKNKLR